MFKKREKFHISYNRRKVVFTIHKSKCQCHNTQCVADKWFDHFNGRQIFYDGYFFKHK